MNFKYNIAVDRQLPNDRTLEAYNSAVAQYIEFTAQIHKREHTPLQKWFDASLEHIKDGGRIFEIGSATPRDAAYMRNQGFWVQCSDASIGFVEYLQSVGEPALYFNVLKHQLIGEYDMIFANAVAPHFTEPELRLMLHSVADALQPGKVFAFSTKYGYGNGWITEKFEPARFIQYWQPHELVPILHDYGFEVVYQDIARGDFSEHTWIMFVLRKVT